MARKGFISRCWKRLARAETGTAAVEFALILPIMLAVYLGTIEASTLITMDRKVQLVAGAVGDLVARAETTISASDMQDYFRAASGIMTPYASEDVLQVVTVVQVNDDGTTEVKWSRQYQDGDYSASTPHAVGDPFTLPHEIIDVARGETVVAAEASYAYRPLMGLIIKTPVNLYRSNFFLPRFKRMVSIAQ